MRRDLIIGFLVAVLLHGGAAYLSQVFKKGPPPPVVKKDEDIIQLNMPPLEPDEPEELPEDMQDVKPIEFAPPMQNDMPQLVLPDSFTIPPTPPPPDSLKASVGQITIPKGNLNAQFGQIFNLKELDQQPQATYQALPIYPSDMKRKGITGEVMIGFIVDSNGLVQQVRVISSTQREFETPAVQAVQKWKFRAGRKGGKNVATRMEVPIVFHLND